MVTSFSGIGSRPSAADRERPFASAQDANGAQGATGPADDASSQGASAAPSRLPAEADLTTKIAALIEKQVESGKLSADQASELKGIFSPPVSSGGGSGATVTASGPADETDASSYKALVSQFIAQMREPGSSPYDQRGGVAASALSLGLKIST